MNGFSAYHISSRGLKYALAFSAFEDDEIKEEEYKKALLNVLTAQEFDSIPLVESYGGPITAIGRRRLHDGDLDDVFILSTEEVSKLPQKASVIRCIFEVLSNEHHIVFLTDEEDQIQDVVTIGMLSSPIIQEYLTLLVSKLSSENWDFNEKYLKSSFTPTYDFPKIIHQELKKLGTLVDDPDGAIPTDFDVSKQIVHILSLLQPLKHWERGQESDSLLSTDFPLTIATPDYIPGTAGYFAQHPFGAVMENTEEEVVQDLAFRLFSEANNWDYLALQTPNGDYSHLLGSDQFRIEMVEPVAEDTELDELVHLFDEQNRPLRVKYEHSPYPGIITPQDVVFSEHTKVRMAMEFLNLELNVRNSYLHRLATGKISTKLNYRIDGDLVWRVSISALCVKLNQILPPESKLFNNRKFKEIFKLRNAMAHNDFAMKPDAQIDPQKTHKYILFLKSDLPVVKTFNLVCEQITTLQYSEFAQIFHAEFKSMNNAIMAVKERLKSGAFEKGLVRLTSRDGVFQFHFKQKDVVLHAKKVKEELEKRNFPWKCEILDVRSTDPRIADDKRTEAAKKKAEDAARERAKEELTPLLKEKIHEMLNSECDENTEIENTRFRVQIQSIIEEARNTFSLSNKEIMSMTKLSKLGCKGSVGILIWCAIKYTKLTRTDDNGKETGYIKITNLQSGDSK